MRGVAKRLWQEEGQDQVEYALFLLLITFAAVASMKKIASSIADLFTSGATSLTSTT